MLAGFPERLANQDFIETVLYPIADRIGLLVVDEAHCISDWGHDFRPDYRRILDILRQLPANTPVLGTTATANNRVVEDIRQQLGDIVIQRGTLARESLALDALVLGEQSSRLAWLATVIPQFSKSGIVYTLTTRDADLVAEWLRTNGISAFAYYSGVTCEGAEDSNTARNIWSRRCWQIKLKFWSRRRRWEWALTNRIWGLLFITRCRGLLSVTTNR